MGPAYTPVQPRHGSFPWVHSSSLSQGHAGSWNLLATATLQRTWRQFCLGTFLQCSRGTCCMSLWEPASSSSWESAGSSAEKLVGRSLQERSLAMLIIEGYTVILNSANRIFFSHVAGTYNQAQNQDSNLSTIREIKLRFFIKIKNIWPKKAFV